MVSIPKMDTTLFIRHLSTAKISNANTPCVINNQIVRLYIKVNDSVFMNMIQACQNLFSNTPDQFHRKTFFMGFSIMVCLYKFRHRSSLIFH